MYNKIKMHMRIKQSCRGVEESSNNNGLTVEGNNLEQSNQNMKDDNLINSGNNVFDASNVDVFLMPKVYITCFPSDITISSILKTIFIDSYRYTICLCIKKHIQI